MKLLPGIGRRKAPPWRPPMPAWSDFTALAAARPASRSRPVVDVVVPAYRGHADTLACLASVLGAPVATPFDCVVIDDATPEPALARDLQELARMGLITLVRHAANRGFVAGANEGMALHGDRDVVLLNADTLVFGDWLDRLRAQAAAPDTATVTPFTNNGTICSYPRFGRSNPAALEIPFGALDALAARINRADGVALPTGVGFCLYLTRRAIAAVGPFDEAAFGRGYGEENDFCRRAAAGGWTNRHALDVFVFHAGEVSFAGTAAAARRQAAAALLARHPDYDERVRDHLAADPARPARLALDAARLLGHVPEATVLLVADGGAARAPALADEAARLCRGGRDLLLAVPDAPGSARLRLTCPGDRLRPPNLGPLDPQEDAETLARAFHLLRLTGLAIADGQGAWAAATGRSLRALARSRGFDVPEWL